jgi:anti-sigma B factor antagonist
MAEGNDGLTGTSSFECRVTRDGDGTAIYVRGDVDIATADELDQVLRRHSGARLVIDLSELTFCDARGLRVLLAAALIRRRDGDRLVLREPSSMILRLLEITNTACHFEILRWDPTTICES